MDSGGQQKTWILPRQDGPNDRFGFNGTNNEKLTIEDAVVRVTGSVYGSLCDLNALELRGTSILSPTGTVWNDTKHALCNAAGKIITDEVVIGTASVDYITFPDEAFRNYVGEVIDKNGDGILSAGEISAVVTIRVDSKGIGDLTGIALFPKLKSLICDFNKLRALDVSANTELQHLYFSIVLQLRQNSFNNT